MIKKISLFLSLIIGCNLLQCAEVSPDYLISKIIIGYLNEKDKDDLKKMKMLNRDAYDTLMLKVRNAQEMIKQGKFTSPAEFILIERNLFLLKEERGATQLEIRRLELDLNSKQSTVDGLRQKEKQIVGKFKDGVQQFLNKKDLQEKIDLLESQITKLKQEIKPIDLKIKEATELVQSPKYQEAKAEAAKEIADKAETAAKEIAKAKAQAEVQAAAEAAAQAKAQAEVQAAAKAKAQAEVQAAAKAKAQAEAAAKAKAEAEAAAKAKAQAEAMKPQQTIAAEKAVADATHAVAQAELALLFRTRETLQNTNANAQKELKELKKTQMALEQARQRVEIIYHGKE